MKTFGPMPDDAGLHRAALAYASDYTLLESILRSHGMSWITPRHVRREPGPRHVVAPPGPR